MFINISAKTGEGKTKQLIKMCVQEILENNKAKIVFVSTDINCGDWLPEVKRMCGDSYQDNFRPMYAKNMEDMLDILPVIDNPPYDVVALDGYRIFDLNDSKLKFLHNTVNNGRGKLIFTSQMSNEF